MEDSRARGRVRHNGQHLEAPPPSHKRAKQATMKRFFTSGGGSSENDDLTRVILEKTDKTKGKNWVKKKYYHPPAGPKQDDFPDYLPMHVVPLFLPPELADALKAELVEEAKTMVSWERKVGGKDVQPLRLTKVVHNEEAEDPLNHKPAFAEATRLMEEYINRKKGEWGESTDEHWKPNFKVINVYRDRKDSLAAHSDTLAIIGDRPLIAGLNLGATRVFRLNLYRSPDDRRKSLLDTSFDYDFHIPHNCAYIMLPGCQEHFKHSVPAPLDTTSFPLHDGSEARYSITYRFQKWPIKNVPKCDHGNPANLHVIHKGNKVGSYLWRCDWTNANNTGICNFRKTYTGDPRGAGGGEQGGGGGGGKVPTPQSWEVGGALEVEGGEGEDRKVSPQEHQQELERQEEEEEEQQVEEEQQREHKAVEIVVVEDDVDEEGEEEEGVQQEQQPAKAPKRRGEVIVIDDDDDDE